MAQIGFSTCFSEHHYMVSSYVRKLKILETSNFTKRFPEEILKAQE